MRSVELTEDQSGWAKFGYAKVKLIPLRFSAYLCDFCVKGLTQRRDRRGPQRYADDRGGINLLEGLAR